jgi:hypothetical protein
MAPIAISFVMALAIQRLFILSLAALLCSCSEGFKQDQAFNKNQTPKIPMPIIDDPPDDSGRVEPADESAYIQSFSNQHPGLINDCRGMPIANEFLIEVVRLLQQKDGRWGFFRKPDGRIPRDILAYAWGEELEGTHNTYVIDFVSSGCNNSPSDPTFNDPAPNASVWWNITNPEGYADNGVWTANP